MALRPGLEAVARKVVEEVNFLAYGLDMVPLRKEQNGFDYGQPMVVSKMALELSKVVEIEAWFANEVVVAGLYSCQAMEPAVAATKDLMVATRLYSPEAVVRSWETSDEGTGIADTEALVLVEEVPKIVKVLKQEPGVTFAL
jgi:hypothetical protein